MKTLQDYEESLDAQIADKREILRLQEQVNHLKRVNEELKQMLSPRVVPPFIPLEVLGNPLERP